MNVLLVILMCARPAQDTLKFEARAVQLPESAAAFLSRNFDSWELCGSWVWKWSESGHQTAKRHADLITGDFDGNGIKDFAAIIKTKQIGYVVALLAKPTGYQLHILDSTNCNSDEILFLVKKGKIEVDLTTRQRYVHRTDAVGFGYYEKAGGTYIYREGRFEYLSTSD